ncbi:MAG TPA: thioesterase family protein [Cyclobacteriaceae bacterium]
MPRLHLNLPSQFIFSTQLTVRVSDLNYGGHVGNDNVLTLMQEARIRFYQQLGFKSEISFEGSVGQIISDVAIVYKSESFLGDQLEVKIAVDDFNKYGFDMLYLITNLTRGKEAARGKTGIVCFDYEKRKVAEIPKVLLSKLKEESN